MATLLIEPFGGFAGDMFLAALLDLEDPRFQLSDLETLAANLVPGEARLTLSRAKRGAFVGNHLEVNTSESQDPPHRHLSHMRELLESGSDLSPEVRRVSLSVLQRLADAEGRVHGIAAEQVHFHEVGAVDTLIDVCGAALGLERLGVTRVLCTPPLTGEGSVVCAHGEMPVPVPAVVELFRGMPLSYGGGAGERLTPTGAAVLAEFVDEFSMPGVSRAMAIGLGAGGRDPQEGPANLVRVQLLDTPGTSNASPATWCLEVNLDDTTGEELGWCLSGLRDAGALDAWCTAVQMKKGRPGVQLSALCREETRQVLEAIVFERTPSLGVRWSQVDRTECGRSVEEIELDGLRVRVKLRERPEYPGRSPFGARDVSPEFDDLRLLAEQTGCSLREAEERVVAQFLSSRRP